MSKNLKSKEMLNYYSKDKLKEVVDYLYNRTFAHVLAASGIWHTYDKEILELQDDRGRTIAHYLAKYNPNWLCYKYNLLKIKDSANTSVAHYLAMYNENWITFDKEILMLEEDISIYVYNKTCFSTVASLLAQYNPRWCYYNTNIINKKCIKLCLLATKKYIACKHKKNILTFIPII